MCPPSPSSLLLLLHNTPPTSYYLLPLPTSDFTNPLFFLSFLPSPLSPPRLAFGFTGSLHASPRFLNHTSHQHTYLSTSVQTFLFIRPTPESRYHHFHQQFFFLEFLPDLLINALSASYNYNSGDLSQPFRSFLCFTELYQPRHIRLSL